MKNGLRKLEEKLTKILTGSTLVTLKTQKNLNQKGMGAIMNRYYPMATYDGKTDNFHTLTTYDSLDSESDCIDAISKWISMGYKIDKCWIQLYMDSVNVPIDIDVKISPNGTPCIVTG